jgi:hypothetical protein
MEYEQKITLVLNLESADSVSKMSYTLISPVYGSFVLFIFLAYAI